MYIHSTNLALKPVWNIVGKDPVMYCANLRARWIKKGVIFHIKLLVNVASVP